MLIDQHFSPSLPANCGRRWGWSRWSPNRSRPGGGNETGVGEDHRSLVAQEFVERSPAARERVTALAGLRPGSSPIPACHRFWHTRPVFHGVPRLVSRT